MYTRIYTVAVVLSLVIGFTPTTVPAQGSVGEKVYWTDRNHTDTAAAGVARANLDGTSVEPLVPAGSNPRFIALDPPRAQMYWTDTGVVRRAGLDGTGIQDVIGGLPGPMGIAVDAVAEHVYWSDTANGGISRANLDGTGDGSAVEDVLLIAGLLLEGIALDPAGGAVYWADVSTVDA